VRRPDVCAALVVVMIWGVNFVAIDFGLRELPPLFFVALRFLFTAVPAIFFVPAPKAGWRTVVTIGMLGCVGQFGFLFVAMAHGLPAGVASVVIQTQALFTVVFAVVFIGEVVTRRRIIGVAVAAAGMFFIAASRSHAVPLSALLLAVAGGASWGLANVVTRSARPARPFSLLIYSALVAPVPLLLLSMLTEGAGADLSAVQHIGVMTWGALAFVVVAATLVGFGLWYRLLARYDSSVVAPYALLVPVVGLFSAWALTRESPSLGELLGSGVVLGGVTLVTFSATSSSEHDVVASVPLGEAVAPPSRGIPS
jgi:O-acetylserine/cysteine efflux transporter